MLPSNPSTGGDGPARPCRELLLGPKLASGPENVLGPKLASGPKLVSGPEIVLGPEFARVFLLVLRLDSGAEHSKSLDSQRSHFLGQTEGCGVHWFHKFVRSNENKYRIILTLTLSRRHLRHFSLSSFLGAFLFIVADVRPTSDGASDWLLGGSVAEGGG